MHPRFVTAQFQNRAVALYRFTMGCGILFMTKVISRRYPYVLSFSYGIMDTNSTELKVFRGFKQAARQTTYREWRYGSTHS